ncbi:MAG: DUF6491 family protein [Caulobacterales bacterium]|nr:DUF6491 family protein [Caulobacterales bacterium]
MKRLALVSAAAAIVAGCQTIAQAPEPDPELAALVEARQGEEVDRICFTRSINNWRALGRDSLLLEKGVNDWFKVDVSGTCDPKFAFEFIALSPRGGSSCLTRGDRIDTDASPPRGFCLISRMYRWDETAEVPAPAEAEAEVVAAAR